MVRQQYIRNIFLMGLWIAQGLLAERPSATNPYSYIAGAGDMAFSTSGAAYLPSSVYKAQRDEKLSPMLQFVLANQMMTKCVEDVQKQHPGRRDPYVVAKQRYDYGTCRIKKCFQQGFLTMLLPDLTAKPSVASEGEDSKKSGAQMAQVLATAFKKDGACDGSSGGGIDPMLLMMIAGGGK